MYKFECDFRAAIREHYRPDNLDVWRCGNTLERSFNRGTLIECHRYLQVPSSQALPRRSTFNGNPHHHHHHHALWLAPGNANDLFPLYMNYNFLLFSVQWGGVASDVALLFASSREDVGHMVVDSINRYDF
jgi:hypothetical protein